MRNSYLFLLIALFAGAAMSAQVKIGDNPQNINPSSVLELESTDKVLVITRVSTAQMNAIVPIQGALCYNTDLQSVHYYDGAQWVNIGGGATGGALTADPIVNTESTIVITPTATGDNLEVAPESITSNQIKDGSITGTDIADGSIGPGKIQDGSVTEEKLSENSVGAFALDNDSFGVSAFNNDVGYITAADVNVVSVDAGNAITPDANGAAFYDDTDLLMDIMDNADAIALDDDQSAANEIQNPTLNGTVLGLTSTAGTVDLGPILNTAGSDNQNLETPTLSAANVLTLNIERGDPTTIDLSPLVGTGSTEEADQTTITGVGTNADPFKIEPGATGQILTTDATGVVWANATPGGGTTEVIDGTTLTGLGTPVDPFKIEPGATGQFLTTDATGVVWSTVTPGGGTTEVIDGTTLTGIGTAVDPFKIEPGAAGQILTTDATGVVWANAVPGGGSTEEADQTTITGVGTNADPFKIEPSATLGQYLRTTAAGVVWEEIIGTGVATDGSTIVGTGVDAATELMVPTGGITTTEIFDGTIATADIADANITPLKIEPSLTNGQFLRTDALGNVIWDDLPAGTGGAVTSDGITITGTGADVASALSVPTGGIATAQIADGTILAEDLNNMGATDGQILKWDNATTSWITAADDSGAAALTDGNIFVGDATNAPQDVPLSGDATIDNTGLLTIEDDAVITAKIANATILAEDLNDMGATDGQVLKWDDATTSWITAADDAGLNALTDGNIYVGDAANTPQDVALSGDATIDNTGLLTIEDDAVITAKIANATILAEDLNDMGATDGQVLKWDDATTSWITAADDTGAGALTDGNIFVGDAANTPQDVALSGDATIDNTGLLTIEDDAVVTSKIANATILAEDLNDMGATADGDILKWNTTLNGTGGWEVGANAGHTGTPNQIFFANTGTGVPVGDPGLIWNPTAIAGGFPALGIGLDGRSQSTKAKVHIDEQLNGAGDISYGLQLQNRGSVGNSVGMIFGVHATNINGKGALLYERTGTEGVGDFHFLQAGAAATGNPGLTDRAFSITNDKDIRLYRGIDIDGVGFGTAGQVLASGGAGNSVQWVNAGSGGDNLSTANLTQTTGQDRTYDLNGQNLVFTGTGNIGIGNSANPPQNKLHVAGEVRSEGYNATFGTAGAPAYSFAASGNPDTDTGMYRPAADQIGFSVGSFEALRIEEPSTGNTNVIVNQSLELDGTLIDTGGQAGTLGQVLSSTVTGTDWVAPSGPTQKGKVPAASGAAGQYTIVVTGQTTTDYIINTAVLGNPTGNPTIIQILGQNTTDFTVQIFEYDNGTMSYNPTNADWFYTIYNP